MWDYENYLDFAFIKIITWSLIEAEEIASSTSVALVSGSEGLKWQKTNTEWEEYHNDEFAFLFSLKALSISQTWSYSSAVNTLVLDFLGI